MLKKRRKVDKAVKEVKSSLDYFSDTTKKTAVLGALRGLNSVRKEVIKSRDVTLIVKEYTTIISTLHVFIAKSSASASPLVMSYIQSLVKLEKAREAAGLYRANVSSVFSAQKPINIEKIKQVNVLSESIKNSLNLSFLNVPNRSEKAVKGFTNKRNWKLKNRYLDDILRNSTTGNYSYEGAQTFEVLTGVVNDIGLLIGNQINFISNQLNLERSSARSSLISRIVEALVLLVGIFIILFSFSRSFDNSMDKVLTQLEKSNQKLEQSSNKIANSGHSLNSSTKVASSAVQETMSSITEIKQTMIQSDEEIRNTVNLSKDVSGRVSQGEDSLKYLLTSMTSISESTEDLDSINNSIRGIQEKTQVINDIVFQTQLLSFNASIEAAKAGVHGKGFSVVAEEVGKLAVLSGTAASEISEILKESSKTISTTIENNRDIIKKGLKSSENVSSVFLGISNDINSIDQKMDGIMNAFNEHNIGIDQVNVSMERINESVQNNVSCSKDAQHHSNELNEDSRELNVVITDLLDLIFGENNRKAS